MEHPLLKAPVKSAPVPLAMARKTRPPYPQTESPTHCTNVTPASDPPLPQLPTPNRRRQEYPTRRLRPPASTPGVHPNSPRRSLGYPQTSTTTQDSQQMDQPPWTRTQAPQSSRQEFTLRPFPPFCADARPRRPLPAISVDAPGLTDQPLVSMNPHHSVRRESCIL